MAINWPIIGKTCRIRPFERTDARAIAYHANNRKVWLNLRDAFPHPYTIEHAEQYIEFARTQNPRTLFCITDHQDQAIGSIGYAPKTDVERVSAEIGYWIGEEWWNRGIATEALMRVTKIAFEQHELTRIFATPYSWNPASTRVLEKAGYEFEGRLRRAAIKAGTVVDLLVYALVSDKIVRNQAK